MNTSRWLSSLFLIVLTTAGCGGSTPEKLCEKAKEAERTKCTTELTKLKTKLDEIDKGLWKDFSDCVKKLEVVDKKGTRECLGTDTIEKLKNKGD